MQRLQVLASRAWWAAPLAVFAALYYGTLDIWFMADDFAWLGLRLSVNQPMDLVDALFGPKAQGTVRFLSERAFFMTFEKLFGINALPMKLFVLATQAANLVLLGLIARRLTGTVWAAVLAPAAWCFNGGLAVALSWMSAYNQVLTSFLLLAALYSFMHRRMGLAWGAFLLSFGALETVVVFPGLALVYTWFHERPQWRQAVWFAVPSAVYTALHLFVIPKVKSDPAYQLHVDFSIASTLWTYWTWAIGAVRLPQFIQFNQSRAELGGAVLSAVLLGFLVWCAARRELRVATGLAWFCLLLAPVLPLRDHVSDYYLASAGLGFALLVGDLTVRAWRLGWLGAAGSTIWLGVWIAFQTPQVTHTVDYYRNRTGQVQAMVEGVVEAHERRPLERIVLSGVEPEFFWAGFFDNPFRLYGMPPVYLTPGSEKRLGNLPGWARPEDFVAPGPGIVSLIENGHAAVYAVEGDRLRNVTRIYYKTEGQRASAVVPPYANVGDPLYDRQLSGEWHTPENGFRWMGRSGGVELGRPGVAGKRVYVSGYVSSEMFTDSTTPRLKLVAERATISDIPLETPDGTFEVSAPLPDSLVGAGSFRIEIEASRVFVLPSDGRTLSVLVKSVAIR
ncbi:MAG: DUF2029 domain-containing protein [Acidobacteria bacterium]|nr:DUF2029 domain-containing protein [Acidobacteriota bacterium]